MNSHFFVASLLSGIQRLKDIGMDNMTNTMGALVTVQQIIQENPRIADTAEFVKEEVRSGLEPDAHTHYNHVAIVDSMEYHLEFHQCDAG